MEVIDLRERKGWLRMLIAVFFLLLNWVNSGSQVGYREKMNSSVK